MLPANWKATELGEIAKFSSGGTPSKENADFWGGIHPWITAKDLKQHYLKNSIDTLTDAGLANAKLAPAGASLILVRGMTLLKDFPVGYVTRPMSFNQDIKALIPEKEVDGLFLSFFLASQKEKMRQLVSIAGHGTGRLDTESIKSFPVNLPSLGEQKKIAKILSTWDQAISTTEKFLTNSQQQKNALGQQLLLGIKKLPGFNENWKEIKLSKLLSVRQEKTVPSNKNPLYSLTIENGITAKTDRYNREALVKDSETKTYKLVKPSDIVFNPANLRWGAINISRVSHNVVVSPIYEVLFVTDQTKCSASYLAQYLMTSRQISKFASMTEGTLVERQAVKIEPFLATNLRIPTTLAEQEKIVEVLSAADRTIETLQQRLACLKREKKALMQQLLTGKRRVKVDES